MVIFCTKERRHVKIPTFKGNVPCLSCFHFLLKFTAIRILFILLFAICFSHWWTRTRELSVELFLLCGSLLYTFMAIWVKIRLENCMSNGPFLSFFLSLGWKWKITYYKENTHLQQYISDWVVICDLSLALFESHHIGQVKTSATVTLLPVL